MASTTFLINHNTYTYNLLQLKLHEDSDKIDIDIKTIQKKYCKILFFFPSNNRIEMINKIKLMNRILNDCRLKCMFFDRFWQLHVLEHTFCVERMCVCVSVLLECNEQERSFRTYECEWDRIVRLYTTTTTTTTTQTSIQ